MKSQELTSSQHMATTESRHAPGAPSVEVGLNAARTVYWWILGILLVAYLSSGTTQIHPGEVGIVRRFGQWVTVNGEIDLHRPGLLFALPEPFDRVEKIAVKQERIVEIRLAPMEVTNSVDEPDDAGEADDSREADDAVEANDNDEAEISNSKSEVPQKEQGPQPGTPSPAVLTSAEISSGATSSAGPHYLLAGDRGILGLSLQVRYRIADPATWLIASSDVDAVIRRVVIAATSSVVGQWSCDDVLRRQLRTDQRVSISLQAAVMEVATAKVSQLQMGVELSAIEVTSIEPPAAVRDAFVAIQNARVDQESWKEEANGEADEIRLNAERMAQVAIADATGKLDSFLGRAAAEIELFEADLAAFEAGSSKLVAGRIQRETWEAILRSAGRVIAVPAGERSQGLWLSVPDTETTK